MISKIIPLAIGNALQVLFAVPDETVLVRLLRKDVNTFSGESDPAAFVVGETNLFSLLDSSKLANGQTYWYQLYEYDGSVWSASGSPVSAVPQASYFDNTVDVQSVVRERVSLGVNVEVLRGALKPQSQQIEVLTAPPQFDQTRLPMFTVYLENENPVVRGIGEVMSPESLNELTGDYEQESGWEARTQLSIVGWALNPDVRLAMRKVLRRILIANLPVFSGLGLDTVEFSMNDMNDFQTWGCPVYQVVCTFTCLSPILIADSSEAIESVISNGIPYQEATP